MMMSEADQKRIDEFRDAFERKFASDSRFGPVWREDRPDGAALASRFPVADRMWLELTIRPFVPQLRAGIVTDDRWKNEELEEKIEESGDTMPEFIEMGFEEAGLDWREPPVEHYRDQGKYFCFSTGIEPGSLSELASPAIVDKITRMFEGYWHAFRPAIERAAASQA